MKLLLITLLLFLFAINMREQPPAQTVPAFNNIMLLVDTKNEFLEKFKPLR